ncbi:hypothetical protein GW17_00061889 [Ensete ventricosum]|nr:hypothetical protein GW17_00061889 [Ensete ventricosum]
MGNRASLLEAELEKLKLERDPEQLAQARQRVDELEVDNAKLQLGLDELSGRLDEADKELNELQEGLVESQHQLKEQKADRRKADDELLKLMRENESLKAELSGKSIIDYKQSRLEDGSVPMEARQEFDDSIPPRINQEFCNLRGLRGLVCLTSGFVSGRYCN